MQQRLYRSETDRMIGGVCGGIAAYLDIDSVWVRVVAVLLAFADGLGLLAYLILWVIVPTQSKVGQSPTEVARAGVEEITGKARELAQEARMSIGGGGSPSEEEPARQTRARRSYAVATILILVGIIVLMGNFGLLWWLDIGRLWPVILIAIGVLLLLRRRKV
ncbi:MAG: hypothetical protein A2Y60_06170 [Chloroflexi bacterium RBG_13_54_9]|nr:MAG: hypothetical protein A2Y60_06170 [Chloroflexi bacterium RBG_13_54_9]